MVLELAGGGWGGHMEGLLIQDNCWRRFSFVTVRTIGRIAPLDRKLVSVKFSGLGLALPTLSLGFWNGLVGLVANQID